MILQNKNILVGVTGSIAIYKALDLIRLYIKAGAKVKVVMTKGAKKFINPITFEAISQSKVLDELSESWDKNDVYNHIDIGKWADILVLAPCSANTINKIANGIADNILSQSILAFTKDIILAPAANTNMLQNLVTKRNIEKLKSLDIKIINTVSKDLVCKDFGNGALASPEEIFDNTVRSLLKDKYWNNREVLLTGGGTIEKIDDVRYLSNFSSGKMANSMAKALYYLGANVTLVATRGYENLPLEIKLIKVQSSVEMKNALDNNLHKIIKNDIIKKESYLFMISAVSDYIPNYTSGKLKKEKIGNSLNLNLKENIDILKSLDKEKIISIGFKAELDEEKAFDCAKNMLKNKNLDAVCLNILSQENNFGSDENKINLFLKNKEYFFEGNKLDISLNILNKLKEEFFDER